MQYHIVCGDGFLIGKIKAALWHCASEKLFENIMQTFTFATGALFQNKHSIASNGINKAGPGPSLLLNSFSVLSGQSSQSNRHVFRWERKKRTRFFPGAARERTRDGRLAESNERDAGIRFRSITKGGNSMIVQTQISRGPKRKNKNEKLNLSQWIKQGRKNRAELITRMEGKARKARRNDKNQNVQKQRGRSCFEKIYNGKNITFKMRKTIRYGS